MPPPKKAAKKHAGPHGSGHSEAKDIRRAYEHLGRVESLRRALPEPSIDQVNALAAFARQELDSGRYRNAAESLRASEHISFAALEPERREAAPLSKPLLMVIDEDLDRLTGKAKAVKGHRSDGEKGHKAEPPPRSEVAAILQQCLQRAMQSRERGELRRALELARAAEALAHIREAGTQALPGAKRQRLSQG